MDASGIPDATVDAAKTLPDAAGDAAKTLPDAAGDAAEGDASEVLDPLGWIKSLAVETGGATALVTDQNRLVRVDLASRKPTHVIVSGLSNPFGVAIESGGASALVVETDAGRLSRVVLLTGTVTTIASSLVSPKAVVIEASGTTALVTETGHVIRITLATGTVQNITSIVVDPSGMVLETGGATALVTDDSQLERVTLSNGQVSTLATSTTANNEGFNGGLALETGGSTALVTSGNGCITRIVLANGSGTNLSCLFASATAFVIEGDGGTVLIGEYARILRVYLSPTITTVATGMDTQMDVRIENGGLTALVQEEGGWGGSPRISRVTLSTGAVTPISTLSNYFSIFGLAINSGGQWALTAGDGEHMVKVYLSTGDKEVITSLLSDAWGIGIALESGDATALIPQLKDLHLAETLMTHSAIIDGGESGLREQV